MAVGDGIFAASRSGVAPHVTFQLWATMEAVVSTEASRLQRSLRLVSVLLVVKNKNIDILFS